MQDAVRDAEPDDDLVDDLLELRRMDRALVRADLARPGLLDERDFQRLRYALGFARLAEFQPGAAEAGGRTDRPDVSLGVETAALRERVVRVLRGPLRDERKAEERLRGAGRALPELAPIVEEVRSAVLTAHGDDFSAGELDAEAGRTTLVSVAGGGGGAGHVYIGAYRLLEREGIVPAYVVGASIGSLIGLFRARQVVGDWDAHLALAKGLDRRRLFSPVSVRRRHGLPALLALNLAPSLGSAFARADASPLRIADLEIGFEAVVAGVRRRSFERLPASFREQPDLPEREHSAPVQRRSPARLAPTVIRRLWEVAAFFDPRVVKAISLGADPLTAELGALDAAGFSAAIPGVLHYEADASDERTSDLLTQLLEREDAAALVDGGVASNVPCDVAWEGVRAGRIGTRNAFVLAFDCFHPQWDPRHLWLQPITQAITLQRARTERYADWVLRFSPTLSPIDLVPEPARFDEAIGWGEDAVEPLLPMLRRALAPAAWGA